MMASSFIKSELNEMEDLLSESECGFENTSSVKTEYGECVDDFKEVKAEPHTFSVPDVKVEPETFSESDVKTEEETLDVNVDQFEFVDLNQLPNVNEAQDNSLCVKKESDDLARNRIEAEGYAEDTNPHFPSSKDQTTGKKGATGTSRTVTPESTKSQVPKRKRVYYNLPREKELAVAKWYQANEFFYNRKLRVFHNKHRKYLACQKMAMELNVTVEYLQKWMDSMRTRFTKLIQETKPLTEREEWIKTTFSFLRPYVVRCPTRKIKVSTVSRDSKYTLLKAKAVALDDPIDPLEEVSVHRKRQVRVLDDPVDPPQEASAPRRKRQAMELDETVDSPEEASALRKCQTMATKGRKDPMDGYSPYAKEVMDSVNENTSKTEHHHALFPQVFESGMPQHPEKILEMFHEYLTAVLETLKPHAVEYYMREALKLAHGVKGYIQGKGGLPRCIIDTSQPLMSPSPQSPQLMAAYVQDMSSWISERSSQRSSQIS